VLVAGAAHAPLEHTFGATHCASAVHDVTQAPAALHLNGLQSTDLPPPMTV
jgi:hypothetical protein